MQKKSVFGTWIILLAALVSLAVLVGVCVIRFSQSPLSDLIPGYSASETTVVSGQSNSSQVNNSEKESSDAAVAESVSSGQMLREKSTGSDIDAEDPSTAESASAVNAALSDSEVSDQGQKTQSANNSPAVTSNLTPNSRPDSGADQVPDSEKASASVSQQKESLKANIDSVGDASKKVVSGGARVDDTTLVTLGDPSVGENGEDLPSSSSDRLRPEPVASDVQPKTLPSSALVIGISKNIAIVDGLLPESAVTRAFARELVGVHKTLRVINRLEYVDATAEASQSLASVLAAIQTAMASVDVKHSDLRLKLENGRVSVRGTVTSQTELDQLVGLLSEGLASSGPDFSGPVFSGSSSSGPGSSGPGSSDTGSSDPGSSNLDDDALKVEPLGASLLQLDIEGGEIVARGVLDISQRAILRDALSEFDNYRLLVEFSERIEPLPLMSNLPKMLDTAYLSLSSAKITIESAAVAVIGEARVDSPQVLGERFRAHLPSSTAWVIEIDPAVIDPAQEEKAKLLTELNALTQSMDFIKQSEDLTPAVIQALDQIFETMFLYSELKVSIRVYTREFGGSEQNLLLSRLRANNMANYLAERGVEQGRVVAIGLGDAGAGSRRGSSSVELDILQ